MSEELRQFEPEDLQFFGEITAAISHEVKNVVTIINESAGLLSVLSVGEESGRRPLDPARIKRMSADMARNVERAVTIINRMNRFAHSVDEPKTRLDLAAVVGDTVALASRFASVRGVDLELQPPAAPVLIDSYAFGLHRAHFIALQMCVLDAQGPHPVQVSISLEGQLANVSVRRGPFVVTPEFENRHRALTKIMNALDATVSPALGEPCGEEIVLSFPTPR